MEDPLLISGEGYNLAERARLGYLLLFYYPFVMVVGTFKGI